MLTTESRYDFNRGRVQSSENSGISAPIDFAGFFVSTDINVGSVANILNMPTCLFSGFELPAPHGLRDFQRNRIDTMTNQISIYKFNQNQIRTQIINGEPWFCLNDARQALNIRGSLKKGCTFNEYGLIKNQLIDNLGRQQEAYFINEPNLYRLIFRSNKPQAQAFADWVYSEVLPSIRKTGGYGAVDMKAIGGMVKKCTAVAIRDELTNNLFFLPAPKAKSGKKSNPDYPSSLEWLSTIIDHIINQRVEQELKNRIKRINKLLSGD